MKRLFLGVAMSFVASVALAGDCDRAPRVNAKKAFEFFHSGERELSGGNYVNACKWFALATAYGGERFRDAFDSVLVILHPSEVDECRYAAREWKP